MNKYRKKYFEYEGKPIGNYSHNCYLFYLILHINQGIFQNLITKEKFQKLEKYLKQNNLSIELYPGNKFSKINNYTFRPIFYGKTFFEMNKRENRQDGKWLFNGACHSITLDVLKQHANSHNNNQHIYAITSLVKSRDNCYLFHSYIYNSLDKLVYDFALNIIMPKEIYDYFYVEREINKLNYYDYLEKMKTSEWENNKKINDKQVWSKLCFLALETLLKEEKKKLILSNVEQN